MIHISMREAAHIGIEAVAKNDYIQAREAGEYIHKHANTDYMRRNGDIMAQMTRHRVELASGETVMEMESIKKYVLAAYRVLAAAVRDSA